MKIFRILLPILISLLIGSAWADAGNRLDTVMQRGTLRVGSTGDYKPFSHRDPASGQYQGIDIEMAGLLAKALGVKLEIVATTWPSLMKDFGEDKFDIAMSGVSVNLERQKKALFSIPYLRDGKTPITRCENKDKFQTLQQIDRPEVKAIVNPGGTNERFARANLKNARIEVYPDNVTIFDQLVAGKADLMITDAVETRLQQKLRPQLCAIHPEAPFDYSEKAYLVPRDWLFKAYVDQWLHQAIQSGAFGKIHDKWIAHPWEKQAGVGAPLRFARETAIQLAWAP